MDKDEGLESTCSKAGSARLKEVTCTVASAASRPRRPETLAFKTPPSTEHRRNSIMRRGERDDHLTLPCWCNVVDSVRSCVQKIMMNWILAHQAKLGHPCAVFI